MSGRTTQHLEADMHSRTMAGILVVAAFVAAACSERNTLVGPSSNAVALSPAGFIGDRPYSWSLKCDGDLNASASWSWTAAGIPIAGTEMSVSCDPVNSPINGTGTRPAAADGFSACVDVTGVNYATCQSWTFDPTGAFKTQLKDADQVYDFYRCGFTWGRGHQGNNCFIKGTATLTVDS
jgi:hypothetical protein